MTDDAKKFQVVGRAWCSSGEADDAEETTAEPRLAVGVHGSYEGGLAGAMGPVHKNGTMSGARGRVFVARCHEGADSLQDISAGPVYSLVTADLLLTQRQVTQRFLEHFLHKIQKNKSVAYNSQGSHTGQLDF